MDYEAELHCCVGGALARSGRVDEAVEAFRSALALDPDYVDAHVNLATLYIRQGKMKEALAACEQALALDPNLAQAHNNLAVLLTGEGRYDEARAHCLAGLRIRPHEEAFHFNLARIHAEQGDPAGVESELKAALVSNPAHLPSHEALARHQMQQGRFEEAREHLQKMTEIDPARADAWFERGNSLVRDGFLKEAVPCLEQAARLAPRDLLARHTLAVALSGCGRSREGICAYQEVLAMDPDFVPSLAGLAWLLSTDPDPDIRDADQALRLAEQAAQLDGAHPNVLSTLAAAYGSAGQFQKAVEAGERAILQARRAGMGGLARKIEARLVLYRAGKPYRASKGR